MAESQNKLKEVQEIFNDYNTRANIKEAKVLSMNVIKKTNTLGMILQSEEYI